MNPISRRTFLTATAIAISATAVSPAWAATGSKQSPKGDLAIGSADLEGFAGAPMSAQSNAASNSRFYSRGVVREYSGSDRYQTAASLAEAAYPGGANCAVIANGETGWPDALTSACLAAAIDGPILLTARDSVPSATMDALISLGVDKVFVVGGLPVVGVNAIVALEKAGIHVEERLAGADRQETQLAIFKKGLEKGYWTKDLIILAVGMNFPDALAGSPIAFAKKAPIFITGQGGQLSEAQKTAWQDAAKAGYGKRVIVLGSEAVIPASTKAFADSMRALANGSGEAERLGGSDRYATSAAIADWAVKELGFSWNNLAVTTGEKPWDALAGSVLQGKNKSVLLLADSMNASTISTIGSHKSAIKDLCFFGGKPAVVPSVRMSIADKLGFPAVALPNFKLYLDAGHGPNDSGSGSYDPGACGSGYEEYDLTKELVNKIAPLLRAEGVDVYVNDDGGPYRFRHSEAVSKDCDALVSIHFNAGGGTGSESLIHSYNDNEYSRTWQNKIHPYFISGMGLADRGRKTQEVAILGGRLPAVLLEICFIDNWSDMQTYQSRKNTVASQIARGIMS